MSEVTIGDRMILPVFQVGDIIRLDGEGWKTYCSHPLFGKSFTVEEVTENGEAMIPIVPAGYGNYYMAWASPSSDDSLYGCVISR